MTFIVVRARSDVRVERSIRETMHHMNLTRGNHAVIIRRQRTIPWYAAKGQGLHHLGRSRC